MQKIGKRWFFRRDRDAALGTGDLASQNLSVEIYAAQR